MACDGLPLQEMQAAHDRSIVSVALVDVRMSRGEMGSEETETCIMILEPDADCTFVPTHTSQAGLV